MRREVAVLTAALVLLTGCTSAEPDPDPTGSPEPPVVEPSEDPDDAPDGTVSVEATYLGAAVTVDVQPVEVQDGVALLTVDYTVAQDAPSDTVVSIGNLLMPATGPIGTGAVRLVDLEGGRVHGVGQDEQKQPATTRDNLGATPGQTVTSQGFYEAPTSASVGVLFPYLGMVTDVPVVELDSGESFAVTPADLGREGEITYASSSLDAFTVAYDNSSSARVTGGDATVSLASDVLFDVDQHVLTPRAQEVVVAAAQEISAAAEGGEVSVVGHTDDVASDEYNQTLSVRRAQSVTAVLAAHLGAGFTVVPEGRGESEPAVAGTSPEARAANRRVEIHFATRDSGAAVDVAAGGAVPEATGPTASGTSPAEVTLRGGQLGVRATAVTRHGAYLIGSLEVERTSSGTDGLLELFGTATQGLAAGRGLSSTTLVAGAHNVTLLGESSRYFPVDYLRETSASGNDLRRTLTDQFLSVQLDRGDAVTVTVVWPDPGGDTVTIDVPDRFRLVDVPVTSS